MPMTEPQNRNPREKDSCFCFGLFFVLLCFRSFRPLLSHQHQHPHASPTDYTNPFFSCPSLVPFFRHSFFLFFLMLSREHPQRRRSFDFKSFRKRTCQQQNGVSHDRQSLNRALCGEREMMVFLTYPFSGMGEGPFFFSISRAMRLQSTKMIVFNRRAPCSVLMRDLFECLSTVCFDWSL